MRRISSTQLRQHIVSTKGLYYSWEFSYGDGLSRPHRRRMPHGLVTVCDVWSISLPVSSACSANCLHACPVDPAEDSLNVELLHDNRDLHILASWDPPQHAFTQEMKLKSFKEEVRPAKNSKDPCDLDLWPFYLEMVCDTSSHHGWYLCHVFSKISMKPWGKKRQKVWTTLNFDLLAWKWCATHCHLMSCICAKCEANP